MKPSFRPEPVDQRIEALLRDSELYNRKARAFPIVLQFHGCGGKKNLQARWAAVAKSAGWAVLVVDSYGHRHSKPTPPSALVSSSGVASVLAISSP